MIFIYKSPIERLDFFFTIVHRTIAVLILMIFILRASTKVEALLFTIVHRTIAVVVPMIFIYKRGCLKNLRQASFYVRHLLQPRRWPSVSFFIFLKWAACAIGFFLFIELFTCSVTPKLQTLESLILVFYGNTSDSGL